MNLENLKRMKVTVDTNILLSGTFWMGTSYRILELIKNKEIILVLSDEIIKEFNKILNYEKIKEKIEDKNLEVLITLKEIISVSEMVIPKRKIEVIKEDSSDNKILECAVEGKVNYLITNDNHLLKIKSFEGIKIIKPEDFLNDLSI